MIIDYNTHQQFNIWKHHYQVNVIGKINLFSFHNICLKSCREWKTIGKVATFCKVINLCLYEKELLVSFYLQFWQLKSCALDELLCISLKWSEINQMFLLTKLNSRWTVFLIIEYFSYLTHSTVLSPFHNYYSIN